MSDVDDVTTALRSCFTGKTKGRCLTRRIGGVVLTVTGFLTCPCHLIVTVPLLASLLAGTALGSFLIRNTGLVYAFASIYFVMALALGYWFLFGKIRLKRDADAACPACAPVEAETRVQERSPILVQNQEPLSGIRRRPKNISQFDARAHTAIQVKQVKQMKQVKQVKQTSLEMH